MYKRAHCSRIRGAFLGIVALAATGRALGADHGHSPTYEINAHLAVDTEQNTGQVRGTMTIGNWNDPSHLHQRCLYLPYADPDYDFDPIRAFDLVPRKYAKPQPARGAAAIKVVTDGFSLERLSPYVIRLTSNEGVTGAGAYGGIEAASIAADEPVTLEFESSMPRWPDADRDEWVYADFHPQALAECPETPNDSRSFSLVPNAEIKATVTYPDGWQLATPAESFQVGGAAPDLERDNAHGRLNFSGRKLPLALLHGFTHREVEVGGTTVAAFYRDPAFEALLPTVTSALKTQRDMFGPLAFPRLVVLETSDIEKSALPGMITINRPRQEGMANLQKHVLNWTEWQITAFVAEQWFGASMTVKSLEDLWLLRGFVDFAAFESLSNEPSQFTLLREDPGQEEGKGVNFDYRQSQDLLAAVLTYMHPYNALTSRDFKTLEVFEQQHSLSYIRHALALRQINWTLGAGRFRPLLRKFVAGNLGQTITPRDFARFYQEDLVDLPLAQQQHATTHLQQWWTSDDWPDFRLLGVDDIPDIDAGTKHRCRVSIAEDNGFSLPVVITVTDANGKVYEKTASRTAGDRAEWGADVITEAACDQVEIDQSHQVFDWDRFNNRNRLPDINFLPGNAKTFADDAYTVLWLPLVTKLPAQPATYELVGQAFRYMHDSITGTLYYIPGTRHLGYSLYYLTDYPKYGSYLVLDSLQNSGLDFANERVVDAGVYKTVSWIKDPYLEFGLRLRNREVIGRPATAHETAAFKLQVTPLNQYGACSYSAKLEFEHALQGAAYGDHYDRDFAIGEGNCKVLPFLELGLRGFRGELQRTTPDLLSAEDNIRFHPQNLNEARLRFDDPVVDRVSGITTAGADILVPAWLPVPDDLYVLKRQTRYRLFADYGAATGPAHTYRDAGVGLWVPFGGDLVGKTSVAVLNFSALVVLYRQADAYQSRAPGLVFDFDFIGKL